MFAFPVRRPDEALIGESPAIQRIRDQLGKAALTEVPVLITGESGTGKELAARLLHESSTRRAHHFLRVSCPAITDQIFAGDAFGQSQAASGEVAKSAAGAWAEADRGTLFLDEIGELDPALQSKVLCALQNCRHIHLGGAVERPIDIRLICATSCDLELETQNGRFRADLFHRINVVRIHMPPLRERASDVPMLMDHFIEVHALRYGGGRPGPLSPSFTKKLVAYGWPGNVRELENMAKRYVLFGGEEHVLAAIEQPEQLQPQLATAIDLTTPLRVQTKRARQHLEKSIILGVLEAHRWNRRKTARSLDISYRALLYKIKEVGLPDASAGRRALPRSPVELPGKAPGLEGSG